MPDYLLIPFFRLKLNFQYAPTNDKLPVELVRSVFDKKFPQVTNKTFGQAARVAFPGIERTRDGGGYIYKHIQWRKVAEEEKVVTVEQPEKCDNTTQTNEEFFVNDKNTQASQTSHKDSPEELLTKIVTLERNEKRLKRDIDCLQEKNKKLKGDLAKRKKTSNCTLATRMSAINLINVEDLVSIESRSVGEGTFGQCYLKRFTRIGNQLVVVKNMKFRRKEEAINEARALQSVASDRFPFLYGVQLAEAPYSIVMEFIGNYETQTSSTLYQVVASKDEVYANIRQQFVKTTFLNICKDVSEGLSHLHKVGILHNDLKTNNVVINNERGFIIDLGKACDASSPPRGKKYTTAYQHIAPEVLNGSCVSYESDLYSLGIIFNFVRRFCAISELRDIEKMCTTKSHIMRPKSSFVLGEINKLI